MSVTDERFLCTRQRQTMRPQILTKTSLQAPVQTAPLQTTMTRKSSTTLLTCHEATACRPAAACHFLPLKATALLTAQGACSCSFHACKSCTKPRRHNTGSFRPGRDRAKAIGESETLKASAALSLLNECCFCKGPCWALQQE